jgi:hypothetical protein
MLGSHNFNHPQIIKNFEDHFNEMNMLHGGKLKSCQYE